MSPNWLEKMVEYFDGKMTNEERSLFESELAANKELSSLFNIYRAIEGEMYGEEKYHEATASLKNTLEKLNALYFTKEAGVPAVESEGDKNKEKENPGTFDLTRERHIREFAKPQRAPGHEGRIRSIKSWKTVAVAAGVLAVLAISTFLYLRSSSDKSQVVAKTQPAGDSNKMVAPDSSLPKENTPATDGTQSDSLVNKNTTAQGENPRSGAPGNVSGKRPTPKNDALFVANFRPDDAPKEIPEVMQEAFENYEVHKYDKAGDAFNDVDPNLVTRGAADDKKLVTFYKDYYQAQSYMAANTASNASKAIPMLKHAMTISPDNIYHFKAAWYLALAYMESGDVKNAENLLKQIAGSSDAGVYKLKAKQLISEIEKSEK